MNDEKKFPPTRYINVGRRNTTMAQAYDARAEISKDMEWDVYISMDEVAHILSEERARLEEAVKVMADVEEVVSKGDCSCDTTVGWICRNCYCQQELRDCIYNLKSLGERDQPTEDKSRVNNV